MEDLHNPIRPCCVTHFLITSPIKGYSSFIYCIAKRFKSNKMINHAMSGSEATLHISEQIMGFKVIGKSTVDHSIHGFTDATCECNRR